MKKVLLLCLLTFSFSSLAQTIRRCNNNIGVGGLNVYKTIQDAHDDAVDGDIIYVEPSTTSYGSLSCTKRLTLYGAGYYLDKNSNTSLDKRNSVLDNISFETGSASSFLIGISCTYLNINDSDITITRCNSTYCYLGTSSITPNISNYGNHAVISKNLFTSYLNSSGSNVGRNCIITNNIIGGNSGLNGFYSSTISNNTINNSISVDGCTITNNIFDGPTVQTSKIAVSGTNNTVTNNLTTGSLTLPTGNGNVHTANISTTYVVSDPWSYLTSEDSKFQLATNSPAIGIGIGGVNAGSFGGPSPYVLSGLPAIPVITNFTTSGVANTTTPLQVNVTIRGNN
jgi:hypothetical protein